MSIYKQFNNHLFSANDPKTRAAVKACYKAIHGRELVDGTQFGIDLYDPISKEFFEVECRAACKSSKPVWLSNGKFKHWTVNLLFRKKKYLTQAQFGYFFMRPDCKYMGFIISSAVSKAYAGRPKHNPNHLVEKGEYKYEVAYHLVQWFIFDESIGDWRRCNYDEY